MRPRAVNWTQRGTMRRSGGIRNLWKLIWRGGSINCWGDRGIWAETESGQERDNARDGDELIVRNIDKDKRMVREERDRERNIRAKAIRGISEDISDMGKVLDRDQDEMGMTGAALTSVKAKA